MVSAGIIIIGPSVVPSANTSATPDRFSTP
jgi:hypothetical protein